MRITDLNLTEGGIRNWVHRSPSLQATPPSPHRSQIFRPARNASSARIATRSVAGGRSDAGGEFVSDAG
jgi:hypothetical protein